MNTIVCGGMDVHKESYTLCCYGYDTDKVEYKQTIPADYKLILKYMEQARGRYEREVTFICGYEAGCMDILRPVPRGILPRYPLCSGYGLYPCGDAAEVRGIS